MRWLPCVATGSVARRATDAASDATCPPFWRELAQMWTVRNGSFSFVGTSRWHHMNRVPFLEAVDKYLWHRAPYCFAPPSGVRTTWVIC